MVEYQLLGHTKFTKGLIVDGGFRIITKTSGGR